MKIKHAELGSTTCGVIAVVVPGSDAGHVELHHDHTCPQTGVVPYLQS